MSRYLSKKNIKEILLGATFIAGGGGGSLDSGLAVLETLNEDEVNIELCRLDELDDDCHGVMAACLGSPSTSSPEKIGKGEKVAVERIIREAEKDGRKITHMYSGEMGGSNTLIPFLISHFTGMPLVDVDGNGRAVPELNTGLIPIYKTPMDILSLGDRAGDAVVAYLKDPLDFKAAEAIARSTCQIYGMRIGFASWISSKKQMSNYAPGCLTRAQEFGKIILENNKGSEIIEILERDNGLRTLFTGKVTSIKTELKGGFDIGEVTYQAENGKQYYIDFYNENMIVRDEERNVLMVVPEIITMFDVDNCMPLTNASVREGMNVHIGVLPVHENWWKIEEGYGCFEHILEAMEYTDGPIRY